MDRTRYDEVGSSSGYSSGFENASSGSVNLSESDSGKVFGGYLSGTGTYYLPVSASVGTVFTFILLTSNALRIDPGSGTVKHTSVSNPDKYRWADLRGEWYQVISVGGGDWAVTGWIGSWQEEV